MDNISFLKEKGMYGYRKCQTVCIFIIHNIYSEWLLQMVILRKNWKIIHIYFIYMQYIYSS